MLPDSKEMLPDSKKHDLKPYPTYKQRDNHVGERKYEPRAEVETSPASKYSVKHILSYIAIVKTPHL